MALDTIRLSAIVGIGPLRTGSPCPPGSDPLTGRRIGPYLLVERVGAGASATVYRARHEVMGIDRALKLLRPGAGACARQRERFMREARIAATIRHPNVVSVYDCGTERDGTAYIVMEYVPGRSLAQRLEAGVPPASETLRVAEQVAAALDHAHRLGVVHRDVKPANVLLSDCGTVRLGDFGIARLEREPDTADSAIALGTPAYMAPEQSRGPQVAADSRSDVYSLAVVVYQMLTGRTPYGPGGGATAGSLRERAPAPPRSVNPYLPEAVDRVLARGLAWDPGGRHESAGRLVAELAAALGDAWAGALAAPGASACLAFVDLPTAASPIVRGPAPVGRAGPARPWSRRLAALLPGGRAR